MSLRARPLDSVLSVATLLFSGSTLICCALPILLVALGFGASVAYLTHAMPWLVGLSRHKVWIFGIGAIYLTLTGWMIYRPGRACPTDPDLARLCQKADRLNRLVLWIAVAVYAIGFFMAYLWLPLRIALGV